MSVVAGPTQLWFGSKAWYWLLPVVSVLSAAWFWVAASKPVPQASVPRRVPVESAAPAARVPAGVAHAAPARALSPEPAAVATPRSSARARAPRASDPLAELALLDRARRVIGKDPARALALAEEHARDYQRGQFAEERELLAVEALVRLERQAAAQRRARAFQRAHPNSVHARRLGVILSPAPR